MWKMKIEREVLAMTNFRLQLLLVEDDQQLSNALVIYYKKQGDVVNHVSSGKAAVNFIICHNPKIVICKDQLVDLNRDEIYRIVRPYFTGKIISTNQNLEDLDLHAV